MKSKVALFLSFLFVSLSNASSPREIRFWEGAMRADTTLSKHIDFIKNTLAPGTVIAGDDALENYIVYLPSAETLPSDAYSEKLSFSEAAIPVYVNNEKYLKARAAHIEYGPLHFIENGFEITQSYSATPIVFKDVVRIASTADKVAYDLRAYASLTPTPNAQGELRYDEPNWQKGTSLVWLQLRKKDVSPEAYTQAVAKLFENFSSLNVSTDIDGHYAKVAEGHILHFINVVNEENADAVIEKLKTLNDESFSETLISFELLKAQKLAPFAKGWSDAFKTSSVINVLFPTK